MNDQKFPVGWDAERVVRLLAHYETISEVEQVAEDEKAAHCHAGQSDTPHKSANSNGATDRD